MPSETTDDLVVRRVAPAALVALRRRVLRNDDPSSRARDDRDDEASAVHFGGFLGERLVASASWFLATSSIDEGAVAYQLRFMATDADVQGRGYGSVMLEHSRVELRARSAELLWAYARDSALGFYCSTGWSVLEGSEHLSEETQLPHTVIYLDLRE